ncbi:MAG: hypothetical protein LRY55_06090 [Leadbetterella sp.]|nr:hypothetical protein [Leadbetterella sp.]
MPEPVVPTERILEELANRFFHAVPGDSPPPGSSSGNTGESSLYKDPFPVSPAKSDVPLYANSPDEGALKSASYLGDPTG